MKPQHAMTFQAIVVGTALALLALVGRTEAAYANGVYFLIAGALYGSYRVTTRSPFRPIPDHRKRLDQLVGRQTLVTGVTGLASLLLVISFDVGPYHPTRILAVVLAAVVIGSLALFLSSLVDWWWILPRISGITRPAPCQCSSGETWVGVSCIWLFHRGLATVIVSGALTAIPAYMAYTSTGHTATAYGVGAAIFGGTLAGFYSGALIALTQSLSPKTRLGDLVMVDTQAAYVVDLEVSGVSYKLLDENDRYTAGRFVRKKSGSYNLSDIKHHPGFEGKDDTVPLCGLADSADSCTGVNWYCRWNSDAYT